jgi:hypothetical protein
MVNERFATPQRFSVALGPLAAVATHLHFAPTGMLRLSGFVIVVDLAVGIAASLIDRSAAGGHEAQR